MLEEPFVAFYLDAKSTVEEPSGLRVLAFKADRFLNYQATR
jgi:hypothetical protein